MTFEESLERLKERHEGLTQAVELMQRAWEDRWAKMEHLVKQDAENIRGLARIAEIHERRLTHLEDEPE